MMGGRRVIFVSSSVVYGSLPIIPTTETLPTQPQSPYGVQKLAAESYCRIWPSTYGLETVALRYFNVFGPAQDPQSEYAAAIPRFLSRVLQGQTPIIYGDGEQSRDFIYISNVVAITLLAAPVPEAAGKVMNVGSVEHVTLNQLGAEIGRIIGRPITPIYEAARAGEIRQSLADLSLMRSTPGYEQAIPIYEELALTTQAFERGLSHG
jgi:UDP-glucose 4-epimerase